MANRAPGATFVHLRVHTAYSLLEGAIRVPALGPLCLKNRMPAVGITDTNNLFGALEIADSLAGAGIQAIIGSSLSLGRGSVNEGALREGERQRRQALPRLPLLAKTEAGYRNLMKLSSLAYERGGSSEGPHVTFEDVARHAEGLIALTGGPEGPLDRLLAEAQDAAAAQLLAQLAAAFPGRLYVEVQRHGQDSEALVEPRLVALADERRLPLVATNEPYFPTAGDFEAHDALLCIADGRLIAEDERRRLTPEHYFKSTAEMTALFADLPDAVANTVEIARRCAFRPLRRQSILPKYEAASGRDQAAELREQATSGLRARMARAGLHAGEAAYLERLDYELDIIIRMGFEGYFLIVSDFMKWTRAQGIPIGVRGSGATSIVAWALDITSLDPLRFGLLFERFLNPERVSMPDFDIDFCQDRRDEVIRYVQEKYGSDRVAQIITFGSLAARAALRDVGRVMGLPYGQVDRLCKLVPQAPGKSVSLADAIAKEPRLQEARAGDEAVARLLDIAQRLEGLYRHASTHAAGVVIGDRPLEELVPLYRDPRSSLPVTQFSMNWVEPAGLIKFDFLGLKTLTVIARTEALLASRGVTLKTAELDFNDPVTYALLGRGETVGVFQVESAGMRDLLRQMKPDRIEDLIALVALYRPGPMDSIPKYIACKRGVETPHYLHPALEPILSETFGVMTYQEDVMRIARALAGYSLGEADLLRRAMSKKKAKEMAEHRARFLSGAASRGIARDVGEQIFDQAAKFADYGFNKGHAAAYAHVLYQTAYLKANHPVEFMAATMALDISSTDKLNGLRQELDRMGIKLLAPDINASDANFSVEGNAIRYALGALKNVGLQAMEAIVAERRRAGPFKDLVDFAERLDPQVINKRALESLARAGAFDGLEPNRAKVFGAIDLLLAHCARAADERASQQATLFAGSGSVPLAHPVLPALEPWAPLDRLSQEFDAVGFYLTGHPLDDYRQALARARIASFADVANGHYGASTRVRLAGVVLRRLERRSRAGERFAYVDLSDPTGRFEVVVFPRLFASASDLIEPGRAIVLTVDASQEGEKLSLRAHDIAPLDEVADAAAAGLRVFIEDERALPNVKARLQPDGKGLVFLVISAPSARREVEVLLPGRYATSPRVSSALKAVSGVRAVHEL